ncbi:hypothetical protein GMRT_12559 [Giardia muris]|uniref:RING-type domain-containing protein n=1 Tax=Giardia muris TaxID=5742 RepID=A0A4Z1T5L8_GIAMU|nr:hypothetical protein GMRT_12559 [Giardia muris]|eukprot:TNJ28427.1 hypothetical protein GMRT_12559 [Giardia muris]
MDPLGLTADFADTEVLRTEDLERLEPTPEVPPFLLCPVCSRLYDVAYCLSCSHGICRRCYEAEIAKTKYLRCPTCQALIVTRPYVNAALQTFVGAYGSFQIQAEGPSPDASPPTDDILYGEQNFNISKDFLNPIETQLCHVLFDTVLRVRISPQHERQPNFLSIVITYADIGSPTCLASLSTRICITVVNMRERARSKSFECVHTFPRGGGVYSIPVGPRNVLFDPTKNYLRDGKVRIRTRVSVFTTLTLDDAMQLARTCREFLYPSARQCRGDALERLIERTIAYRQSEASAHVVRFLLQLARHGYTVLTIAEEGTGSLGVVTLSLWLKHDVAFARLLRRAMRHIDTADYELVGAVLGRHCLIFLEASEPGAAFDVTLKDGELRDEDLDPPVIQQYPIDESPMVLELRRKLQQTLDALHERSHNLTVAQKDIKALESQLGMATTEMKRAQESLERLTRSSAIKTEEVLMLRSALCAIVSPGSDALDEYALESLRQKGHLPRIPNTTTHEK